MFSARGAQIALATAAVTGAFYGRTALSPLQEAMRVAAGLTDNQVAILQGPALAFPLVVLAIPLGIAIDRMSRARLLQLCAILGIAGHLLTAIGHNLALWFFARALVGLAAAVTIVAAVSFVADLVPPEARGRGTMALAVGQVGGSSAAFAVGGALLGMTGTDPGAWRLSLVYMSLPWLLLLLALTALREPPRSGARVARPPLRVALQALWALRAAVLPLFGGVVVVDVALGAAPIWAAPDLSRSFGLSPGQIGSILAVVLFAGGVLGPILGGLLADRGHRKGGPRRTLLVMSGVAGISALADFFAIAPSPWSAAILLCVFNVSIVAISVAVTTLVTVLVPNELRCLCLSLLAAAQVLFGLGLAPLAVSALTSELGGPEMVGYALTAVCFGASTLCAMAFAIGSRYQPAVPV